MEGPSKASDAQVAESETGKCLELCIAYFERPFSLLLGRSASGIQRIFRGRAPGRPEPASQQETATLLDGRPRRA